MKERNKKRMREYKQRPEVIKRSKEYYQRPEVKERKKESTRAYDSWWLAVGSWQLSR